MEPAISIRGLTKPYGDLRALDNLSMEVREGEFFGFLGPNGAGKTTTITILAGLTTYKDGEVEVFGKDVVRDYREARKDPAVLPRFRPPETSAYCGRWASLPAGPAQPKLIMKSLYYITV